MIDKQIIIDGVDVSGCECYSEHREGYCGWHIPCEGDTCPYKLKWVLQQLQAKEQECLELKERLSCNCFDPKSNNNRCVSYNRMAEDYERDLKRLNALEACIIKIVSMCEKASTKSTFCNGVENKDMQKLAIRILKVLNDNKV